MSCMVGCWDMARFRVCALADLPPGSMTQAGAGETDVVVCNVNGELHALANECPHAGGPLGMGTLHGNRVVCPYHAWEFDCRTGEYDFDPAVRVGRYLVEVKDGDVFVEVD